MGKVSLADKMRIQTLREQRLGAKAIVAAYPEKNWALSTVKKICQCVDQTKNFYLNPPVSYQNSRVWARGKKADVKPTRLLVQREKFAKHVMVSAGVCFSGKGRLHFVQKKAKVDGAYYVGQLLPNLVDDCNRLLPTGFVFQQVWGAMLEAYHTSKAENNR